mmetsp:Transcript_37111/g.110804  ORF Transcript_37111/g.110804 Transcript_37111/m.110804 type:complete len:287 (+) Transcript_37111:1332-2192(+)
MGPPADLLLAGEVVGGDEHDGGPQLEGRIEDAVEIVLGRGRNPARNREEVNEAIDAHHEDQVDEQAGPQWPRAALVQEEPCKQQLLNGRDEVAEEGPANAQPGSEGALHHEALPGDEAVDAREERRGDDAIPGRAVGRMLQLAGDREDDGGTQHPLDIPQVVDGLVPAPGLSDPALAHLLEVGDHAVIQGSQEDKDNHHLHVEPQAVAEQWILLVRTLHPCQADARHDADLVDEAGERQRCRQLLKPRRPLVLNGGYVCNRCVVLVEGMDEGGDDNAHTRAELAEP